MRERFRLNALYDQMRAGPAAGQTVEGSRERVDIDRLYITITACDKTDRDGLQSLLDAWYRSQAEGIFAERLAFCFPRVEHLGVSYPRLLIRAMKTRWGNQSGRSHHAQPQAHPGAETLYRLCTLSRAVPSAGTASWTRILLVARSCPSRLAGTGGGSEWVPVRVSMRE